MALLGLAAAAEAGEVPNGSQWTGGGGDETITVTVTDDPAVTGGAAFYSVDDSSPGQSPTVPGAMGPHGTDWNPTVTDGDETSTSGGEHYRAHGGKMQRKGRNGQWKDMRIKKKKSAKNSTAFEHISAGQRIPHDGVLHSLTHGALPVVEGDSAPWAGFLGGEEITSLPE